ncbi:MAG: HEAT repeat domain-containing protein [Planctomycetes bacterium]|nr:HEAT repeat domain-containing protein [Planctomycetota bacterium]
MKNVKTVLTLVLAIAFAAAVSGGTAFAEDAAPETRDERIAHVRRLVEELGSDQLRVREDATKELLKLAKDASYLEIVATEVLAIETEGAPMDLIQRRQLILATNMRAFSPYVPELSRQMFRNDLAVCIEGDLFKWNIPDESVTRSLLRETYNIYDVNSSNAQVMVILRTAREFWPATGDVLKEYLSNPNVIARRNAAMILTFVNMKETAGFLRVAMSDRDSKVRAIAVRGMVQNGYLHDIDKILELGENDGSEVVRYVSTFAARFFPDKRIMPFFLSKLEDESAAVRMIAAVNFETLSHVGATFNTFLPEAERTKTIEFLRSWWRDSEASFEINQIVRPRAYQ